MFPASSVIRVAPDLVFDVERDDPAVFACLVRKRPQLQDLLAAIRHGIPLATSCADGMQPPFYRLPRHYRSVCLPLQGADPSEAFLSADVVAFKGTEPLLPDFDRVLAWMETAPFRGQDLPMAWYFPLVLKMPPGAMPLDECLSEHRTSMQVQTAHLEAYGELAPAPVPLAVHRFSAEHVRQYLATLERHAPRQAVERVRTRVSAGLGVGIYYSPGSQLRVEDLFATEAWLRPLLPTFTPSQGERVVDAWVRTFARLLHLGYVPYAPWNAGWGACVDSGNACIDGGIVDLGTLVTMDSFQDYRQFRLAWAQSMDVLSRTVLMFCAAIEPARTTSRSLGLATLVSNYIAPKVAAAVAAEAPRGARRHPWLDRAISSNGFTELLASLKDGTATVP